MQMRQDVMPCALCASFPADDSVEATEVPTPPAQHVLPKALPIALSLIKPASPFTQAAKFEGLMQGAHGAQARRVPAGGRGAHLLGSEIVNMAARSRSLG